jgi:hypothetical protein
MTTQKDQEAFKSGGAINVSGSSVTGTEIKVTPHTGGPITWMPIPTPLTTTTTTSPSVPRLVDLPSRITKKVLVAFLEGDDELVWGKKLAVVDVDIKFDSSGEARMTLELLLQKVYED